MKSFGLTIREARKKKNLSFSALSELTGLSRVTLSSYESNRDGITPTDSTLELLCNSLDLNYSSLKKKASNIDRSPKIGTTKNGAIYSYRKIMKDRGFKTEKDFIEYLDKNLPSKEEIKYHK